MCIHIQIYVCIHIYIHIYMYIYTRVCVYVFTCKCFCIYMHVFVYVDLYTYTRSVYLQNCDAADNLCGCHTSQAPFGHAPCGTIVCAACYTQLGGVVAPCPTCTSPLGSSRDRGFERVRDKFQNQLVKKNRASAAPPSTMGPGPDTFYHGASIEAALAIQETKILELPKA